MTKNENENMNDNENDVIKKDEPLRKVLFEGAVASIIASVLMSIITALANYFWGEYGYIFPDFKTMIIYFLITVALLCVIYVLVRANDSWAKISQHILMAVICILVFVLMLRFMTILFLLKSGSNNDDFLYVIKNATLIIFELGNIGILYIFTHRLYLQIQKKEVSKETKDNIAASVSTKIEDVVEEVKSYSSNVNEILKKMDFDTAVTSTVIPFSINKNGTIRTYLIANSSYPEFTWMFPGGHVLFSEEQSPETIAVSRAKDEANLTVSILDINGTFDVLSLHDNQVSNMTIFKPPHFLYLFKLDEKTKCYNDKGHEFHMDIVYIAEVNKEEKVTVDQKRVVITLSPNITNLDEINQACHAATHEYYRRNRVKSADQKSVPDYVETMLYNAFVAYKKYNNI